MRHRPKVKSEWQKITEYADQMIGKEIDEPIVGAITLRYRNKIYTFERDDDQNLVVCKGFSFKKSRRAL